MCDIPIINIDDNYIVRDKSTSDGSQIKYNYENKWYKIDNFGGEGEAECLASLVLECSGLPLEDFVLYDKMMINGSLGCVSDEFRRDTENESFISFYRLYKNINGRDLAEVTSRMDYDDAISYVIDFIQKSVGLDVHEYLANTLFLDEIILNTDRHFNNYGIIMNKDSYRTAPIFDNGKSLLVGCEYNPELNSIADSVKQVYSKTFSADFGFNSRYLKKYRTMQLDFEMLYSRLKDYPDSIQKKALMYQLNKIESRQSTIYHLHFFLKMLYLHAKIIQKGAKK